MMSLWECKYCGLYNYPVEQQCVACFYYQLSTNKHTIITPRIEVNMETLIRRVSISTHETYFNALAHDEIASIGSYLSLNNYINLSLCNRLLYACLISNPIFISKMTLDKNQLQKYVRYQKKEPNTQSNVLKMINNIQFDVPNMSQFNQKLFPSIQILELWFDGDHTDDLELLKDINYTSINELLLRIQVPDDFRICTVLSKMNNVHNICLDMDNCPTWDVCLSNLDSFKNLKGIITVADAPNFIDSFKHQLESLHIYHNHVFCLWFYGKKKKIYST
eukprot:39951_1